MEQGGFWGISYFDGFECLRMIVSYEPLLQKGIHEMTVEQLYECCVSSFSPNHARREHLFLQLTDFLIYFQSLGFSPAEVWVDGSFLTQKPEPGDIDLLITVNMGEVALLPRSVQDLMFTEFGNGPAKRQFECEVLLAPSADQEMINERLKFFSNLNQRNTFKKKGIIKLKSE